ncbi:hypothetical protein [Polyangium sp. 6x1]|uniref:hypothetical protein n=1 Tax=Polyangium sp. 6x1 TaxID=3042689 RepID=UPI002482D9CF|nr:hypothetical protein [Polyangium sp. 6x1]MDI1445267.1 hypothetical protein [Polyangium sp. 6x1]
MDRPTHKQDWKETKLWTTLSALDREDAQTARKLLTEDRCMPAIQHVLDQGGTELLDFTLHESHGRLR